jgi:hypothetical protein
MLVPMLAKSSEVIDVQDAVEMQQELFESVKDRSKYDLEQVRERVETIKKAKGRTSTRMVRKSSRGYSLMSRKSNLYTSKVQTS